jgi:hypothetical protein
MNESPIFTRTHDLLLWLIPATGKSPRQYRFGLAARLNDGAFTLQEQLTRAAVDKARTEHHLIAADVTLNLLRKRLLLCYQLGLLSVGQYQHVSGLTRDIGNLLGTCGASRGEQLARPRRRVADTGTGPQRYLPAPPRGR